MGDVGDLETRHQFENLRPVRRRIAGDGGFGVTFRAVLPCSFSQRARSYSSRHGRAIQNQESMPYGGSVTIRIHLHWLRIMRRPRHWWHLRKERDACRRASRSPARERASLEAAAPRWRAPRREWPGSPSISPGSKPVRLRSKSAWLSSWSSRANRSSVKGCPRRGSIPPEAGDALTCAFRPVIAEDDRDLGGVGPRATTPVCVLPSAASGHRPLFRRCGRALAPITRTRGSTSTSDGRQRRFLRGLWSVKYKALEHFF